MCVKPPTSAGRNILHESRKAVEVTKRYYIQYIPL
ncbi:hypothetical protein Phi47:1_gp80 [Cellulophaga phage phi47:1]|nr:hypothetical protein Phi3ST:2_gp80 [Cellulophaga phage phi3ST:2]AGO48276.1 hypothetical protein PhiSM_gp81 [Cellulophaga phage phiSM]AGO49319.1 hypothetical protein Phi38:2_gp80 [Cellulophaga phage phi38:2]AGO49400.1 hypothetical protein Phi3:1_gp81 [Cellulophaga phage phi3:1]AGO49817.1 hypothetical protein Phi47:1_gp80 [Cellulophaga phage phi47:1]